VDLNRVDTTTGIGEDRAHKEVAQVAQVPTAICMVEVLTQLMVVLRAQLPLLDLEFLE
jgi:hypothetical protein